MDNTLETKRSSLNKQADQLVIDIDRHLTETWNIFQQYAEPEFRDRVYSKVNLPDGSSRLAIDNRPMPFSTGMWDDPSTNEMFEDGRFAPNDPKIKSFDLDSYLTAMSSEGIDIAIATPTLAMGSYSNPDGGLGSALCRAYARWAREFCSPARDRLFPFYPVNLYDIEQAVKDGKWAIEQMNFRGFIVISLPVGKKPLHHPDLDPFWAIVQELDVPVLFHTLSPLPDPDGGGLLVELAAGVSQFGGNMFLNHLISHRMEQHLVMASLMVGGVLERFPQLRVMFVEAGGGWVASWLEEMDSHYDSPMMRKSVPWLRMKPSDYMRRQCLIGFTAEEQAIGVNVPLIGVDHVAWSSDYPHYDGVFPGAVDSVRRSISNLPANDQAKILGGNAARFFNLI